jgi:hypothetical protein
VPIALGYLDYKLKKGGIGIVFTPSGDYNADYEIIRDFYKNLNACHPEKFNLSKMYWDVQKLSENMQPNDI